MIDRLHDSLIRKTVFEWLEAQSTLYGDVLPRSLLQEGVPFFQQKVHIIGPQGIFKPRLMEVPISIATTPSGPYTDAFGADGLLQYRYRGTDPNHRDNRGLRFAMKESLPLVYFHGIVPGRYLTVWPVYIVSDAPDDLTFTVAVDDRSHIGDHSADSVREANEGRRQYVTAVVRRRLHQRSFRERVLRAYRHQCALCRLRHEELLDAAHITPDSDPDGEPSIDNGIALCRLHHSAFDRLFIGIRPDYTVEVRPDILTESDGPTLKYAIQGLHNSRILLPHSAQHRPSTIHLAARYEQFRRMTG